MSGGFIRNKEAYWNVRDICVEKGLKGKVIGRKGRQVMYDLF